MADSRSLEEFHLSVLCRCGAPRIWDLFNCFPGTLAGCWIRRKQLGLEPIWDAIAGGSFICYTIMLALAFFFMSSMHADSTVDCRQGASELTAQEDQECFLGLSVEVVA